MSRRSPRLMKSGYYRTDDEDATNRTNISYHESPSSRIFKKRTRYSLPQVSFSSFSFTEEVSAAERYTEVPPHFLTCSPATSSTTLSTVPLYLNSAQSVTRFSSRYSSLKKNELPRKTCYHSRSSSFMMVALFSSETADHRKAVLTVTALIFGLTLALGFCCSPLILSDVSTAGSLIQTQILPLTTTQIAEMNKLRDEIFSHVTEREAKWKDAWIREMKSAKRELSLLKQERLKQTYITEMLKIDLNNLKLFINKF